MDSSSLPRELPSGQKPPLARHSEPSFLYRIFHDHCGNFRAGWRVLLFLILFFASMFVLGWVAMQSAHLERAFMPLVVIRSEGVMFASALIASAVMARLERRPFAMYGLPWRQAFQGRFWEGGLWGFLAISVVLAIMHEVGVFMYGGTALAGTAIVKYGAIWAGVFLLVGFSEEYVFRGYPLFTLSTGMRFWPAALLLSALFGAIHLNNGGEDWLGAFTAGLIGLFFCLTLRRTGSLWFAIGAHMGWDWGETFFYGVPDSGQSARGHLLTPLFHGSKWLTGGTVGPEGSVVVVAVIVAMFVLFNWRFPGKRYPRKEVAERRVA